MVLKIYSLWAKTSSSALCRLSPALYFHCFPIIYFPCFSTSFRTLSLNWLFRGACREWVFWAMHVPTNRHSHPPSSFFDTLTLLTKCWLPASSSDPCQIYVWRSGCHSVQGYSGCAVMILSRCRSPVMTQASGSFFAGFSQSMHRLDSYMNVINVEYCYIVMKVMLNRNIVQLSLTSMQSIYVFAEDQFRLIQLFVHFRISCFCRLWNLPTDPRDSDPSLMCMMLWKGCCRHLLWTDSPLLFTADAKTSN